MLGMLAVALVFGMTIVGCSNGGGGGSSNKGNTDPQTVTYTGKDTAGNEYTLIVEEDTARAAKKGDRYTMRIKSQGKEVGSSSGTVTGVLDNTLTFKPSDGSEFNATIGNNGTISSIVGTISLGNGTTFTVRTFDAIYMRVKKTSEANASVDANGYRHWGEQYNSYDAIKLKDVFDGNLDNLIMYGNWSEAQRFAEFSGTVDTKLNHLQLDLFHAPYDGSDWIWFGGASPIYINYNGEKISSGTYHIIDGNFKIHYYFWKDKDYDILTANLPEGEIIVQLTEVFSMLSTNSSNVNPDFGKIPDNIPNGRIMATLRNLKLELITDWSSW